MKENDNQFINNYTSISATIYYIHNCPQFKKKKMETSIINIVFNKNERRYRDVKTHEQDWEVNIGLKLNKPLPYR